MASPQVFVVVGMHRSGTSLTMQALGQLGLESGDDLLPGNDYNQRGYWEAAEVVAVHDQLLSDFDRPWGAFQHLLPLPDDWLTSASANVARSRILEILQTRLAKQGAAKAIAIKDPRMSLFLPLWYEAATTLGVTLRTIICLRNFWDVAQSLLRRDAIPVEAGRLLWLLYTATALRDADPDRTALSYFDDWTSAPEAALARLARFTDSAAPEELRIYEPGLATQTPQIGDVVVQRWHDLLQQCRTTGKITEILQHNAVTHLQNAQHFRIWPDVLGDGRLQNEMSTVLARELKDLKQDRDAQAFRAKDLLLAYQTEAARSIDLQSELDAVRSDRDAQVIRAKDLLSAYQTEAARSLALQSELGAVKPDRDAQVLRAKELLLAYQTEAARSIALQSELDTVRSDRDAQVLRAKELLLAYQTEAARAAALAARLARFNPKSWFRRSPGG